MSCAGGSSKNPQSVCLLAFLCLWGGVRGALLFTAVLPLASITAAELPQPWTPGASNGRQCFLSPEGQLQRPDEVVEEAAKFVDVISVQPYESTFSEAKYDALHRLTDRPIIISD